MHARGAESLNSSTVTDSSLISVVVPIYNEERNVQPLIERLAQIFNKLGHPWEVIFALDPCPDRTEEVIRRLIADGHPIRLIRFSRRIGKPLSLMAGLDHAKGAATVVIDADLQDPPELIEEMVRKWKAGFKVVIAQRTSRKGESFIYLQCAKLFYRLLERIAEVDVPRNTGDFRLMDARVVQAIRSFRERHGFLRGICASAGFSTTVVPFERDPRFTGKTQISFLGALNIALDGIIPFSRTPLRLMAALGAFLGAPALAAGIIWFIYGLLAGFSGQWPVQLLSILLVLTTGIVVGCLGIIGEYVVRIYEETRSRPLYIVDEIVEEESVKSRRQG